MFRVWQSATMAYGAIGESDIIAGRDSPILWIEHGFPLGVWLPLVPTVPA